MYEPHARSILSGLIDRRDVAEKPGNVLAGYNVLSGLNPVQLAFVEDPAKQKVAVCGRRAGKTWAVRHYMVQVAIDNPGARVGYICKTRAWAEELLWDDLMDILKQCGLHDRVKTNVVKLKVSFPNGAIIQIAGAKDKSQAEVLRGFAYALIIIDEAGSINPKVMRYILREVLPAALGERRGTLAVIGTPPASCSGYFFDIAHKPDLNFSHHSWTVWDNPQFNIWAGCENWKDYVGPYLESERERYGWTETDPEYLREYFAKWIRTEDLFILQVNPANEISKAAVPEGLIHVIGVDLGFQDEAAFVVLGYDQAAQKSYHVADYHNPHLGLTSIMEEIHKLQEVYSPQAIVVDPASGGKHLIKDLGRRYNIPCLGADKLKKAAHYRLLRAALHRCSALVLAGSELVSQLKTLEWDEDFRREKEGIPNDLADAYLYAWYLCYDWYYRPAEPELSETQRMIADKVRRMRKESERDMLYS